MPTAECTTYIDVERQDLVVQQMHDAADLFRWLFDGRAQFVSVDGLRLLWLGLLAGGLVEFGFANIVDSAQVVAQVLGQTHCSSGNLVEELTGLWERGGGD